MRGNAMTLMTEKLEIRDSVSVDFGAIELLYPDAFPDEDLLPLVRDLLPDTTVTTSIVGEIDSRIVGHVIFTKCGVTGERTNAALLGPLAVTPARQGQGIGSALVRAGLRQLKDKDVRFVCVLGDPAFYGRLGFLPESSIRPPFRLSAEYDGVWQSQNLCDMGGQRIRESCLSLNSGDSRPYGFLDASAFDHFAIFGVILSWSAQRLLAGKAAG
jgi:putative acetyltransferase